MPVAIWPATDNQAPAASRPIRGPLVAPVEAVQQCIRVFSWLITLSPVTCLKTVSSRTAKKGSVPCYRVRSFSGHAVELYAS